MKTLVTLAVVQSVLTVLFAAHIFGKIPLLDWVDLEIWRTGVVLKLHVWSSIFFLQLPQFITLRFYIMLVPCKMPSHVYFRVYFTFHKIQRVKKYSKFLHKKFMLSVLIWVILLRLCMPNIHFYEKKKRILNILNYLLCLEPSRFFLVFVYQSSH